MRARAAASLVAAVSISSRSVVMVRMAGFLVCGLARIVRARLHRDHRQRSTAGADERGQQRQRRLDWWSISRPSPTDLLDAASSGTVDRGAVRAPGCG